MSLTPEQRSLRAKMAAHAKWAKTSDRKAATASARGAIDAKLLREIDPDGTLDPGEREIRLTHARKAYMAGLALKSSRARSRAAAATAEAETADAELSELAGGTAA